MYARYVILIVAVTVAAALFAWLLYTCRWHAQETFDDADVGKIFVSSRPYKEIAEPSDPSNTQNLTGLTDPPDVEIDAENGAIAMALLKEHDDVFDLLRDWYKSDQAYDLDALQKALNDMQPSYSGGSNTGTGGTADPASSAPSS